MRYNLTFRERRNSTSINIIATHNSKPQSSNLFEKIPPYQDCCVEKLINDKENIKYINGRTTKCRCRYAIKINHGIKRAKAIILIIIMVELIMMVI